MELLDHIVRFWIMNSEWHEVHMIGLLFIVTIF